MESLTWWTWVWASSGSQWWTRKPGVLQSMGSQRVGLNWANELNPIQPFFLSLSMPSWPVPIWGWLCCFLYRPQIKHHLPQKACFLSLTYSWPLFSAYCPKLSILLPHFILLTRLISTCNDNIYLITRWLFLNSGLSLMIAETLTVLAPTSSQYLEECLVHNQWIYSSKVWHIWKLRKK